MTDEIKPAPSIWKRLKKNKLSFVAIGLLIFFIGVMFAAPWLAPPEQTCPSYIYYIFPDWLLSPFMKDIPCKPHEMPRDGFTTTPLPPNAAAWATFPPDWHLHPLGTTENRYDIWYGLVWGTRTALFAGALIVLFSFVIGLLVGGMSGYFGGWVDAIAMRFVDFMLALPGFLVTLVLVSVIGRGLDKIILASIIFGWTTYARLIRGDILSVREREYIQATRALGAGHARILFQHIVPNMIYPALILASLDIGTVVLGLSAFSFLGLGSGENYADWGQMIALARNRIAGVAGGSSLEFWYTYIFPGLAIFFFVLAWNLIGDTVRDILDPRQRGNR
ncbi:ABC transporter permease [Candidatus Acetothermia bacterium]|nr:ABC transporter permease [Candidatus Acetothermia bacterium]MBI3644157.1 ABC transporter permease [Candidatus Acetothermia bacterium]